MNLLPYGCYSIIILKPDFIERSLFTELKELLEKEGLCIIGESKIFMNLDFVKDLYQWDELLYPKELKEYLCSMDMPIWVIKGCDAIKKIMGLKKKLRKKYSIDPMHTLIHCPDSHNDLIREYKLLTQKTGEIMKTNNQVEVIVFKEDKEGKFLFLMLKRIPEKGGFWQPITGNVDPGEKFEEAAIRELEEELSITKIEKIIDTGYSFNFFDDNRDQLERVFGVRIASDIIPRLSREHTEMQWATSEECLNKYLKYPGNKEGLKELVKKLEGGNECSCSKG